MTDLKPCPFCGAEAIIGAHDDSGPNAYIIVCQGCMAATRIIFNTKASAHKKLKELWNSRTSDWQPIEMVEQIQYESIWLSDGFSMRIGYWMEGPEHEVRGSIGGGWRDFSLSEAREANRSVQFTPAYWMPLPTSPEAP